MCSTVGCYHINISGWFQHIVKSMWWIRRVLKGKEGPPQYKQGARCVYIHTYIHISSAVAIKQPRCASVPVCQLMCFSAQWVMHTWILQSRWVLTDWWRLLLHNERRQLNRGQWNEGAESWAKVWWVGTVWCVCIHVRVSSGANTENSIIHFINPFNKYFQQSAKQINIVYSLINLYCVEGNGYFSQDSV